MSRRLFQRIPANELTFSTFRHYLVSMKISCSSKAITATHFATADGSPDVTRRKFLASTGAAAVGLTILKPGLVGGGGGELEARHWGDRMRGAGGLDSRAAGQERPLQRGRGGRLLSDRGNNDGGKLNVPSNKRFTGLSGYKRLLEEKVDAVAIESPPYFHPEQAAAAVEAGKHVYLAKPIAVDVPGCQSVRESGAKATEKKLAFQVDFQTRAMPSYQEVISRVHKGGIGKLVTVYAEYQTSLMFEGRDSELRKDPNNPEVRLRAWGIDRVLSGDVITEQNIHALDVATWIADANPIKAYGRGGRARPFLGDCWDHYSVLFFFPNDLMVTFTAKQVGFGFDNIMVRAHGNRAGSRWPRRPLSPPTGVCSPTVP